MGDGRAAGHEVGLWAAAGRGHHLKGNIFAHTWILEMILGSGPRESTMPDRSGWVAQPRSGEETSIRSRSCVRHLLRRSMHSNDNIFAPTWSLEMILGCRPIKSSIPDHMG